MRYSKRHTMRHDSTSQRYVLSSSKTYNGEPLTGKFYGYIWKDGETVDPISYREAMRVARLRGCDLVKWEESKAFKAENSAVSARAEEASKEAPASVFGKLSKRAAAKAKKAKKEEGADKGE